jgi:hypothetical protein
MLSYSSQVSWILMTVRLNQAFWLVPFTVRDNPPGLVAKVSTPPSLGIQSDAGGCGKPAGVGGPQPVVPEAADGRSADRFASFNFLYASSRPVGGGRPRPAGWRLVVPRRPGSAAVIRGQQRSVAGAGELCHPRMPGWRTLLPMLSAGSIPVTRSTRRGPDRRRRSLGVGCLPFAVRRSRVRYWAKVEPLCDCEHAISKVMLGYSGRQFQRGS